MKVYTFFTDSHRELLDIFLAQFPYDSDTEVVVKYLPQECEKGEFMSDGWISTMKRKVEYVLQALNETPEGEWFVHADCDIVLFDGWKDIWERNKDKVHMIVQNDHSMLCAGFFFCQNNTHTQLLWKAVWKSLHQFDHDQSAMNYFIKQFTPLKVGVLPDSFFTYGYFKKDKWTGQDFEIPDAKDLKMFHANWTEGVPNKVRLLKEAIRQKNFAIARNTL